MLINFLEFDTISYKFFLNDFFREELIEKYEKLGQEAEQREANAISRIAKAKQILTGQTENNQVEKIIDDEQISIRSIDVPISVDDSNSKIHEQSANAEDEPMQVDELSINVPMEQDSAPQLPTNLAL